MPGSTLRPAKDVTTVAREVVTDGLGALAALEGDEVWRFGEKVWCYSEKEHRALVELQSLIEGYLAVDSPKRPLCLAVFGQPGSGKSFGVRAMRDSIEAHSGVTLRFSEFNLTQFASTDELAFALRQVAQDGEGVPFVFFDEFDAPLSGTPLGWLSWLLAPMQDGAFRCDGELTMLTRAIYVFAGGTAHTMAGFGRDDAERFRAAKGPDFVSRLRGFLDVQGPNAAENLELRRAASLAIGLDAVEKTRGFRPRLGDDLRDAAMSVGRFSHGQRSVEAVIEMTAANAPRGASLTRDHLPPDHLLAMHTSRGPLDAQLIGGLVGLSGGGGPPGGDERLGAARDRAWSRVASMVWRHGGTLAYGGDWHPDGLTWTTLRGLDSLPIRLSRGDGPDGARVEIFARNRPARPIGDRRVVVVPVPPPRTGKKNSRVQQAAHLFRMRWQSGSRCRARVLMSGKLDGYSGRVPGIFEEAMIALALRQPVYVVGAFGGAAAQLGNLLGLSTDWPSAASIGGGMPVTDAQAYLFRPPTHPTLPLSLAEMSSFLVAHGFGTAGWVDNGLSIEENRRLLELGPDDVDEIATWVQTGLLRILDV